MKTKLLKKVRKRFVINHYPKGMPFFGEIWEGEFLRLTDNSNGYFHNSCKITSLVTFQEGLNFLKDVIVKVLRKEYGRTKRKKIIVNKVWYNKAK